MIPGLSQRLVDLAKGNDEYAKFNKRIVNTKKQVLGVRMPDLRRLAKQTAKNLTAADVNQLLDQIDRKIYEQVLLTGLIINAAKISESDQIKLSKKYLKPVDSWAEIDAFAQKKSNFDEKL